MASDLSHLAGAFGLGAALGASPGPVQMVLLTESARAGARHGFRAMAGANGTFGLLLLAVAAGVSLLSPGDTALRVLRIVGGAFLLYVAADTFLSARRSAPGSSGPRQHLDPAARGVLAVLLNPGAWLFLATTASAFMSDSTRDGGRGLALAVAAVMLAGIAVADGSMVVLASTGRRHLSDRALRRAELVMAVALAALGGFLLYEGVTG